MRFLPVFLLIAAPLLAQEPTEAERRAEEERRAAEERQLADQADQIAAEKAAYEKRAEELRRLADQRSKWGKSEEELKSLLEELRSKSEANREKAMEELKRVNASFDELLPILADVLRAEEEVRALGFLKAQALEPRTIFLAGINADGGGEVIHGSADGTEYSLKSLGDGKYELSTKKHGADGRLMEHAVEQGTLAELREKHAFLKGALALQVPAPVATARAFRGRMALDPKLQGWQTAPATATLVTAPGQYVTWDGGGRVGVSVVAPSEDLRFHLQLPEGAGFIVQQVVPGSRAEQIGIRRMDILMKLDGELIDSPIQLKKLHEKTGVLEILRRAEAKKIDLATIPEEKPAAADSVPEDKSPAGKTPDAPAGAR